MILKSIETQKTKAETKKIKAKESHIGILIQISKALEKIDRSILYNNTDAPAFITTYYKIIADIINKNLTQKPVTTLLIDSALLSCERPIENIQSYFEAIQNAIKVLYHHKTPDDAINDIKIIRNDILNSKSRISLITQGTKTDNPKGCLMLCVYWNILLKEKKLDAFLINADKEDMQKTISHYAKKYHYLVSRQQQLSN